MGSDMGNLLILKERHKEEGVEEEFKMDTDVMLGFEKQEGHYLRDKCHVNSTRTNQTKNQSINHFNTLSSFLNSQVFDSVRILF